jgi:methylthioribose-1-phosphate isomerase
MEKEARKGDNQYYLKEVPVVRPYFDVTPESPVENFIAEAPRHLVLRVEETLKGVS